MAKNPTKQDQLHSRILQAFNDVPKYEGFTTRDLAIKLDMPEPTARLHLELLTASKAIESYTLGKTKLYKPCK